jgi:hypothetical protein
MAGWPFASVTLVLQASREREVKEKKFLKPAIASQSRVFRF